MSAQNLPDRHPEEMEQPARRPGRPRSVTDQALLDRGVELFVRGQGRRRIRAGMTVEVLASDLRIPATTFRDRFGRPYTESIPSVLSGQAGAGRRHRSDAVARYFDRLTQHVLTGRPDLADPTDPVRQRFLRAVGAVYVGLADSKVRTVLERLPYLSERKRLSQLEALTGDLGHVPNDRDRAHTALALLVAVRTLLPHEATPGPLLRVELDAVDAFATAASGPSWKWRYPLGSGRCLPALQHDDVDLTTAALRAEARVRHGVPIEAVRSAARADQPAVSNAQIRGEDLEVTINLAIARGLAERGDITGALSLLASDEDSSVLLLTTLTTLWHAAVASGVTTTHADISRRIRCWKARWGAHWTDHETLILWGPDDDPEIEDVSLDEALALVADDEKRLGRLSRLCAEQLTNANWREGRTVWTLPQTVEVVVHELRAAGQHAAADQLTVDLFATLGWNTLLPELARIRTDHSDPLPGLETVPLPDQLCCQRLQGLLAKPLGPMNLSRIMAVVRAPVEPFYGRTCRIRQANPTVPTGKGGVGPARALPADPEQLLDALVRGDIRLSEVEFDGFRKLAWLLDLRAGL